MDRLGQRGSSREIVPDDHVVVERTLSAADRSRTRVSGVLRSGAMTVVATAAKERKNPLECHIGLPRSILDQAPKGTRQAGLAVKLASSWDDASA